MILALKLVTGVLFGGVLTAALVVLGAFELGRMISRDDEQRGAPASIQRA